VKCEVVCRAGKSVKVKAMKSCEKCTKYRKNEGTSKQPETTTD
jgi:hypothetical protein